MKKLIIPLAVLMMGCTAEQISKTLNSVGDTLASEQLTETDVANGLKEALIKGAKKGSDQASKTDGFYKNPMLKIPFPPKVQEVESKLRAMGFNKLVDDFVLSMNRGAEKAAGEAKPVFVNAISQMTVRDAWDILKGDKDAATNYLRRTTSDELKSRFRPIIKQSLDEVNATKYFTDVINTYNKIPLVEKVNPNLEDYVTDEATTGMFKLIEKEEANIRENPGARTTELLKKVFAEQ